MENINIQLQENSNEPQKNESNNESNVVPPVPPNYDLNNHTSITPMRNNNYFNQNNYTSTDAKENLLCYDKDHIKLTQPTPDITAMPDNNKIEKKEIKEFTKLDAVRKIFDIILIQIIIITFIVTLSYTFLEIKLDSIGKYITGGVCASFYAVLIILFCCCIKDDTKDSKCLYNYIILFSLGITIPLFIYAKYTIFLLILILSGVLTTTICAHLINEVRFLYYFLLELPLPLITALLLHFVFKINDTILIVVSCVAFFYFLYFVIFTKLVFKYIMVRQYIYAVVCHNIWLLIIILALALGGGGGGSGSNSNNNSRRNSNNFGTNNDNNNSNNF